MRAGAVAAREYPESAVSWLSGGRARFLVATMALAAFYSVCWHLARVDPGDRIIALRAGRVVADAPAGLLDERALEQIYASGARVASPA